MNVRFSGNTDKAERSAVRVLNECNSIFYERPYAIGSALVVHYNAESLRYLYRQVAKNVLLVDLETLHTEDK
jgi:hypothetical protein